MNNRGERPEFVAPTSPNGLPPFDDFSYHQAVIGLLAHEGRPGHDLQFSSMLDKGISTIRALYAFNNVNVEGWGLYAEDLVFPYVSAEEQLALLQFRLWRVARMFLDPEVQLKKVSEKQISDLFVKDLGVSPSMASLEIKRYTFEDVGQAPAYYYGLIKIRQIKAAMSSRLGLKFSEECFNNFVLAQGLLPLSEIARRAEAHSCIH